MKITILDDVFEWPNFTALRDSFTLAEEAEAEEWADGLWEAVYRDFWSGGRKAARAVLFVLYKRHHPDAAWSVLENLTESQWSLDVQPTDTVASGEPEDPTSAPEGAGESESSGSGTSSDS